MLVTARAPREGCVPCHGGPGSLPRYHLTPDTGGLQPVLYPAAKGAFSGNPTSNSPHSRICISHSTQGLLLARLSSSGHACPLGHAVPATEPCACVQDPGTSPGRDLCLSCTCRLHRAPCLASQAGSSSPPGSRLPSPSQRHPPTTEGAAPFTLYPRLLLFSLQRSSAFDFQSCFGVLPAYPAGGKVRGDRGLYPVHCGSPSTQHSTWDIC